MRVSQVHLPHDRAKWMLRDAKEDPNVINIKEIGDWFTYTRLHHGEWECTYVYEPSTERLGYVGRY